MEAANRVAAGAVEGWTQTCTLEIVAREIVARGPAVKSRGALRASLRETVSQPCGLRDHTGSSFIVHPQRPRTCHP
jgi:hypothetical protein